jgi:hypothetical protein
VVNSIGPEAEAELAVVFSREDGQFVIGNFTLRLVFSREEGDLTMEDSEVGSADVKIAAYMKAATVDNFTAQFQKLKATLTQEIHVVSVSSPEEAIKFFVTATGLAVLGPDEDEAKKGNLTVRKAFGEVLGKELVLAEVKMAPLRRGGIPMRITVKADSHEIAELVMKSLLE